MYICMYGMYIMPNNGNSVYLRSSLTTPEMIKSKQMIKTDNEMEWLVC